MIRVLKLTELIRARAKAQGVKRHQIRFEVCQRLGVGPEALAKYERAGVHDRGLPASFLIKLSDYFGVTCDDLINPLAREVILGLHDQTSA